MHISLKSTIFIVVCNLLWLLPTQAYGSTTSKILSFHQIEPFINTADLPRLPYLPKSTEIKIITAGNEYEPARAILKPDNTLGITTASISPLTRTDGKTLPDNSIELRNVLRWNQLVPHAYKLNDGPRTHTVDELLVFDSTESLNGNWEGGRYIPPTVKETFRTEIKADTEQQIWITTFIKSDQPAGTYKGNITLLGEHGDAVLPITIEVLPFNLPEPDKYFGIFYRGSLANNRRNVSPDALRNQLLDIKQHGFNSLVINEFDPDHINFFFSAISEAGLTGPIILNFPHDVIQDGESLAKIKDVFEVVKGFGTNKLSS